MSEVGNLRAYCCGGAGINIGKYFAAAQTEAGYAKILATFIDTSRSNLNGSKIGEDNIYLLPNVDGSGKVRKENYNEISGVIKQILLQHKPGDFNVVICSASGGSGSVIGPLLVRELQERELPVVIVLVGSDESAISAQNTINTLKSLEAISKATNTPVVMYYDHNEQGKPRSEADERMRYVISSLAILTSRQNDELDSRDIANWLSLKTTTVGARLALLEVCKDINSVNKITNPISVASLLISPDEPTADISPEYACAGYVTHKEALQGTSSIHYVITTDAVNKIGANIQDKINNLEEIRRSRVQQNGLLTSSDVTTNDGLVL